MPRSCGARTRGAEGSVATLVVVGILAAAPGPALAEGFPAAGGEVAVVEQAPGEEGGRAQGRGIEYGAHLVVPIPLHGVFSDDLGAGVGVHGRVGWELPGGFSFEANLGYLYFSVLDYDLGSVDDNDSFSSLYGGVGARFAVLNPSAIVPFVGAGLGFNLWFVGTETGFRGRSGQTYCGSDFSCTLAGHEGEGTFGGFGLIVNGAVGVIYEVTAQAAIELGAQCNFLATTGPFDHARQPHGGFLTLFAGGTLYY